ncbi:MAG TPA: HAMP domain-containing protein, partial [Candidatus Limnocylindrales bacterium]
MAEPAADRTPDRPPDPTPRLSFRSRLTVALIAAAVIPVVILGVIVVVLEQAIGAPATGGDVARVLLFAAAAVMAIAILFAYAVAGELTAPLRSIARSVDRVSAGDLRTPIRVAGDDELARLAESHNRLAADLERRNGELRRILAAIDHVSPSDDVAAIVELAGTEGAAAFGMIDAVVVMGDP